MSITTVTARARVERRRRAAGLSIAQLHTGDLPDHLDPFLAFDHFEMAEPYFPPHPHAGFSAVTYMLPESENGFVNRDSFGERIEIRPGDLHWTAAGRGLMHEEVPIQRGIVCNGLQIFVNLHSSKKWMPPQVLHLSAADVPRVKTGDSDTRVVVGAHGDARSPLTPPTDVTLLDIEIAPGGTFLHEVPRGESRFVYVITGDVAAGPSTEAVRVQASEAAGFSQAGDRVLLRGGERGARVIVAGGAPLREPVLFHGPFCMNTRDDLMRAVSDYEAGKMGRLEPSFHS